MNVAVLRGCPLCLFVLFLCFHVILDDVSGVSAMRQAFYAIGFRMGKKTLAFVAGKKKEYPSVTLIQESRQKGIGKTPAGGPQVGSSLFGYLPEALLHRQTVHYGQI